MINLTSVGAVEALSNSSLALVTESLARVGFSPASTQFVNQSVGATSPPKQVNITNNGSANLILTTVTLSGPNAADFNLTVTGLPVTLNPGASLPVTLTFTASATGQRRANLVVTDNAPDSPQTYPVLGFVDPSALNGNWAGAQTLTLTSGPNGTQKATVDQYISTGNSSKWFKITAGLNAGVVISLTNASGAPSLPADYDLAVYKDLQVAYNQLILPQDLVTVASQAAPYEFLPYEFLPYEFLPYEFLPYEFLPYEFLPYEFLPYEFLSSNRSAEAHLPYNMVTEPVLPNSYQSEQYNSALRKGILSLSIHDGLSPESIKFNTFTNTGDIYIRVRSAGGATSIADAFHLDITVTGGACAGVAPIAASVPVTTPTAGSYKTLLITDQSRVTGSSQDKNNMFLKMTLFAARPEVNGLILDLSNTAKYQRVAAAQTQADLNKDCAFAKNIVATEIKSLIDSYRPAGVQYIVLAGSDTVVPFIRYPDKAGLAPESGFTPILQSGGAGQSAVKNNLILSQDAYGSKQDILFGDNKAPVADLAVGRLVESANEISTMLDAYTAVNGVVRPQTALTTGYDFVSDVATSVKTEFEGAINPANCTANCRVADNLIQGYNGTGAWTATDLRTKFLGSRHDLVFLAGHFSPGHALAADNSTSLGADELSSSTLDMRNVVFLSVGCHSGYNIPAEDSIPGQSEEPDWAQTLNRKGMTGVIGTGYQYGDTDLVEYSERLYLGISQQMRIKPAANSGLTGMPIGLAFRQAKQKYLSQTVPLNGMHSKVVLEATLYGLPMLQINTDGVTPPADPSIAGTPAPVTGGPGQALGLATTDYTLNPTLTTHVVTLTNSTNNSTIATTYLSGKDNVAVNNIDLILPLELRNAGANNLVLRGVGFRGGTYTDLTNIFPLTASSATEYSRSRVSFQSSGFYPPQPLGY